MFQWLLRKLGLSSPFKTVKLGALDYRFQEMCSICHDELGLGKCYVTRKCNHIYHKKCIKEWREISYTCPLCRTIIVPWG